MNQDQRKFLIDRVSNTHRQQVDIVKNDLPIKPSLNNYLVAACLDGSIELQDVNGLREKIRQAVLKYGKDERLVTEENSDYYGNRRNQKKNAVTLEADDIFVIPKAYQKALKEYNDRKKEVEDKIRLLDSQKETITLKIQIGSNAVLDKLIAQVDNLADLNIMNSQLLLIN